MNENKTLLKNTGLIAIGNLGAKVLTFLLLPLYTSILSTEEYGTFDFIVALSSFLIPLVSLSMNEAMFRFIIEGGNERENVQKNISHALALELLGMMVLGLIMAVVSLFYDPEICLYVWAYVCFFALYTLVSYLLRSLGNTKFYTVISLTKTLMQLLLNVLVVAVLRWGYRGLIFSLCVSEAIAFLVVLTSNKLWRYIRFRNLSKKHMQTMLRYSLPLVPNALCGQIINLSDRLIISGFLGTAANGVYSVSYKFPNIIETVYHYFYLAWSESASRVIEKGKEYAQKYYQDLHDMLDNLVFSVVVCMISAMPILFRIFVKGDYLEGFDYIPLLTLAMYFSSMGRFYSGIYTALKKTSTLATSTMIGAAISFGANLILISWLGLYAAAISNLLAQVVVLLVRKVRLHKDMQINTNWKGIIAKAVITMVALFLYSYDNWVRTASSMLLVLTYSIISNKTIIMTVLKSVSKKK